MGTLLELPLFDARFFLPKMGVKIYMRRTQILNATAVKRTTFQEAKAVSVGKRPF